MNLVVLCQAYIRVVTLVSPTATALTVAVYPEVPPVIVSSVVKVPDVITYDKDVLGLLRITTPVAVLTLPVIVSPGVNVPVELAIVNVGATAAYSNTR